MTSDVRLTHTLSRRRLRNGDWVYVSEGNQLVVLTNETVEKLNSLNNSENSTLKELIDLGIVIKDVETSVIKEAFKEEPKQVIFKVSRLIVTVLGALGLVFSLVLIVLYGFPFERAVDVMINNPMKFVFVAISTSIVTTIMHELMHVIFSSTQLKINLNVRKSIATVPLTHVWTWGLLGRVTAITSGMSLDSIILCSTLYFSFGNRRLLSIIPAVLITRILWQFRVTQKTDVTILFRFLTDNPFLFEDMNGRQEFFNKLTSLIVTIIIMVLWLLPVINELV